ncbi:MAG: tetratricopeptide repeat protein [Longimicrobiaceae bacterium]
MLEENGPEAAVVLWQILQDVTLWGMIAPEKRGPGLFHDEPGEVGDVLADLRLDLEALQVLVRDSHADAAPIIASLCTRIMTWAEEQGRTGTALSFAQAAALVDRTNPRCAYQVGRQARRKADLARATAWYQRAIVLARRAGDWETEARSYSGLGLIQWQAGNRVRSVELQERVIRIARRYHLREVRADAYFDLAVLNYELGNPRTGLASANLALRLYGSGHYQIQPLAQNIAVCWMDFRGAYREALIVLREMATLRFRPTERVRFLANLARAAGGNGERALFETAWTDALSRMDENPRDESHADALLVLARAALLTGDVARADFAGRRALSLALETGEQGVCQEAESLLAQIQEKGGPSGDQRIEEEPDEAEERARAVEKLLSSLRTIRRPSDEQATTHAAVFAEPDSAEAAYALGMLFRELAEHDSASVWFERARELAARSGQWKIGAESLMRLASIRRQASDIPGAIAAFEEARELAQRHDLRETEGAALHDLCIIHFEEGAGDKGFAFAREALLVYEPGSTAIAKVAHDVAVFMMQNRGDYANALTVFRELENHTFNAPDQLLLWGSIARSAAGAGEMLVFDRAWESARKLIERMGVNREQHAAALINLGEGALSAGRIDWAEAVALRAREIGEARSEAYVLGFAEDLLSRVRSARKTRVRPRPFSDPSHNLKDAGRLARQLVSAMRARGSRTRRPRAPEQQA